MYSYLFIQNKIIRTRIRIHRRATQKGYTEEGLHRRRATQKKRDTKDMQLCCAMLSLRTTNVGLLFIYFIYTTFIKRSMPKQKCSNALLN